MTNKHRSLPSDRVRGELPSTMTAPEDGRADVAGVTVQPRPLRKSKACPVTIDPGRLSETKKGPRRGNASGPGKAIHSWQV